MKNENKLKLIIGNDFTDRNTEQVSCCSHVSFLSFSRARFPLPVPRRQDDWKLASIFTASILWWRRADFYQNKKKLNDCKLQVYGERLPLNSKRF